MVFALPRRPTARVRGARLLGVVALAIAPGCANQTDAAPTIDVDLVDFAVALGPSELAAGTYDLRIANRGPTVHELVIARTQLDAKALPLRPDGIDVLEESLETVAADEFVAYGTKPDLLRVRLSPGRYVLYCNVEGHYRAGMTTALEVRS